jgi:hypothetical protein
LVTQVRRPADRIRHQGGSSRVLTMEITGAAEEAALRAESPAGA